MSPAVAHQIDPLIFDAFPGTPVTGDGAAVALVPADRDANRDGQPEGRHPFWRCPPLFHLFRQVEAVAGIEPA